MNNISDFFRDPRLDNFDDPQEGVAQLDDLMDPVQPKIANKMVRFFSGALANNSTILLPDGTTTFLKITPEYWILRLAFSGSSTGNQAGPLLISRQGGDDLKVHLPGVMAGSGGAGDSGIGMEKRIILPGSSQWLRLTTFAPTGSLYYMIAACTGYNPTEIF